MSRESGERAESRNMRKLDVDMINLVVFFFLTGHSIGVPLELCPPSKNNKVSVEQNCSFSYVSKCA